MKRFYHLFGDGGQAGRFIISLDDFKYEFNLVGVCSFVTEVTVVGFTLEDSHPHFLLYGEYERCLAFEAMFEKSSITHIVRTRGDSDGVNLNCELILVEDTSYLMNVAAYVIVQPTKDGKGVMYYDYLWGTGSMYFRPKDHVPIWTYIGDGVWRKPERYGDLTVREQRKVGSLYDLPDDWLVVNGVILPDNYVDVHLFESIFKSHNAFRTFAGAGNKQLASVGEEMARVKGVYVDDMEARRLCLEVAMRSFGTQNLRQMDAQKRLLLGKELRYSYRLSFRQISTLLRVSESELVKYLG